MITDSLWALRGAGDLESSLQCDRPEWALTQYYGGSRYRRYFAAGRNCRGSRMRGSRRTSWTKDSRKK